MDRFLVGSEYADHLTDADLGLLASVAVADTGTAADASSLRSDPVALLRLLEHPGAFRTVLGGTVLDGTCSAARAAPLLGRRCRPRPSWCSRCRSSGPRPNSHRRATCRSGRGHASGCHCSMRPPCGTSSPRQARRLFLAELLASFTRVASGRYRTRVGGRMRTRRFSELDPVRLAGLLEAVPPAERPGVYRRLGDVTLFLTGVFPDYATAHALGPVNAARLLRAAQLPASQQDRLADSPAIEFWEHLGARWYRAARDLAPVATARITVVGEVADRFRQARRVLNHVADQYLFPSGNPWFAQPGS